LVQHAAWRWIFFINLPIAAVVLPVTLLRVPESRDPARIGQSVDWIGALLAAVGLGGIVFALIEPQSKMIAAPVGILALIALLWLSRKLRNPLISLALFRSRMFCGANLLTFFLYAALSAVLFFLPLNMVQIQGYSATEAGAALLPIILLIFLLSRWSGALVERYGARLPLTVGPVVAAFGFASLAVPGSGGNYWSTFFPGIVLVGLGMAVSVAPLTTTVMNSVTRDNAGAALGINNAVSRVAGLLAIAVLGFFLIEVFDRDLDRHLRALSLPSEIRQQVYEQRSRLAAIQTTDSGAKIAIAESFVAGFRWVVLVASVLSVAGCLTAALLIDTKDLLPAVVTALKREGGQRA
jgi:MFS family permease